MSSRPGTVILDIDGTLIHSNDQHALAYVIAATEIGIQPPPYEKARPLIGMGADKVIPRLFGCSADSELGRLLIERKGMVFRGRLSDSMLPTRGARALLERLHQEGYRLVVATSGGRQDVDMLLDRVGVSDLIDAYTSGSDVANSKPDPDIVYAAMKLAGIGPDEAIMLGDTPYDVKAATGAGVRVVGVRTGGWSDDDLAGSLAVYADPAEILENYAAGPFA